MRYMLLICGDDSLGQTCEPVEPWVEELSGERGVRLHGHRLGSVAEATTVRVRDGGTLRSDGPFAETKEQVAGYDVLECDSLEEAVEAAAKHPMAAVGAVEVRPIDEDQEGEPAISRIETELSQAAEMRDIDRIVACYAPDAEVFHAMSGLEQIGIDAFRKCQEQWFSAVAGPVRREVQQLRVRVDESVGFSHALVRLRATSTAGEALDITMRVTTGYRDFGMRWLIVHQHMSVPVDNLAGAGSEESGS
jgi:ketosteroid isomerase-like protein